MRRTVVLIIISVMAVLLEWGNASATIRTFAAGSYVIPMDKCWQPNNDPTTPATGQTGCDPDINDRSVFQAYGLVYAMLDMGDDPDRPCTNKDGSAPFQKKILGYCKPVKIYWIIDQNKTSPQSPDLTVSGATTPLATVFHSKGLTGTGATTPLNYVGGPFAVDVNDITQAELDAFLKEYPDAKVHRVNVEFSGNVDKILLGKPPKVAVLNEGAITVLEDYLRASGLFSWENYVFVPVSANDIYTNPSLLDNFQLLWAPHWIVDQWSGGIKPTTAMQDTVINRIRAFLEAGNAGFFECASIESMESSVSANNKNTVATALAKGGFLLSNTYSTPRVRTNGGCQDVGKCTSPYLKFENVPFWLVQCGGWSYTATGGHVHNMRPHESKNFLYLTTKTTDDAGTQQDDRFIGTQLTRFIHDDPAKLNSAYSPGASQYYVYDYLVGGRINGAPTQGYVVYFPGHKYIKCNNADIPLPPERHLTLTFSHPSHSFAASTVISVELVHNLCAQGNTCPKAEFNSETLDGTTAVDANSYVDLDSAIYDQNTKTLSGVIIGNKTNSNLSVSKLVVSFPGNDGIPPDVPLKLSSVIDTTTATPVVLCSPNSPSVASCVPANYVLGQFLSTCQIDWTSSNTCGIKYVLNTLLALKYQVTSSEFTKTQPIVKDNILFKASYEYPIYRGHLRMIKVPTSTQAAVTVWDAANAMPAAGTSGFQSAPLASTDTSSPRYIFANLPGTVSAVSFDPDHTATLRTHLGAATDNDAKVIINTVRGRKDASTADVYSGTSTCTASPNGTISDDLYGCGEDSRRLWAIENSTPALKTYSKLIESTATAPVTEGRDRRDRIVLAGADDGMLHAFWAGTWDSGRKEYPDNNPSGLGSGKELWAYIPSALLSKLKNQPFHPDPMDYSTFEPAVAVDGSPALGDFLVCTSKDASDNCTTWEWRTRLVGTAMVRSENRGIIFALDVTDPYSPGLLWESTYDRTIESGCRSTSSLDERNCNMGNTRGVAIGTVQVGETLQDVAFLTSSWIRKRNPSSYSQDCTSNPNSCVYGVSAFAVDIATGAILWEKKLPYTGDAVNVNETPATPALTDVDNNGTFDYLVFGDFQGRLWALRTTDGESIAGSDSSGITPAFIVKDGSGQAMGSAEPIGAPVSVYRDYVVFGTGGADYANDTRNYHVYTVKVATAGSTLVNQYETTAGEKVWSSPLITKDLNVLTASAKSYYEKQKDVSTLQSSGRLTVINLKQGTVGVVEDSSGNQWLAGGIVGGLDVDRKHAYGVLLRPSKGALGQSIDIVQVGQGNDFTATRNTTNPFKILWWRKL